MMSDVSSGTLDVSVIDKYIVRETRNREKSRSVYNKYYTHFALTYLISLKCGISVFMLNYTTARYAIDLQISNV